MVKVRTEAPKSIEGNNIFRARFNVHTAIPVNIYPAVRHYNQAYLDKLKAVNGDNISLPPQMNYRNVSRGDVLTFGDTIEIDEDTGHIKVYPKEVYEEMSRYMVELPCLLFGPVEETYEKIKALATPKMRAAIEKHAEDTQRFRTVPYLEKYTGTEPDLED